MWTQKVNEGNINKGNDLKVFSLKNVTGLEETQFDASGWKLEVKDKVKLW